MPLRSSDATPLTLLRTHRRASSLLLTCMMVVAVALSACVDSERVTAPSNPVSASAASGTNQSLTEAFIDAQGTYCVRDIPGDCDAIDNFGLGYITSWCSLSCAENPSVTTDFAGVNRKWWDRNGLSSFATYSYTGSVTESRLADGRRRLVVNIHGHNTFVLFFSQKDGFTPLVGADALEYPIFSDQPRMPVLGDVSFAAELILPATFVGMPDVTQFFFLPEEGMEVRRMSLTATTTGPLRVAYDGMAAGTDVDVRGHFVYLPKLATKPVGSRRLIARGYEAMSRVTVQPTKAP